MLQHHGVVVRPYEAFCLLLEDLTRSRKVGIWPKLRTIEYDQDHFKKPLELCSCLFGQPSLSMQRQTPGLSPEETPPSPLDSPLVYRPVIYWRTR